MFDSTHLPWSEGALERTDGAALANPVEPKTTPPLLSPPGATMADDLNPQRMWAPPNLTSDPASGHGPSYALRSTITAIPWPPPMHAEATPQRLLRFAISISSV